MSGSQHRRDEWLEDVDARQRNIVFPDTVENERRLWNRLVSSENKLSWVQRIGVILIAVTLLAAFIGSTAMDWRAFGVSRKGNGFWSQKTNVFGDKFVALMIVGLFVVMMGIATRGFRRKS